MKDESRSARIDATGVPRPAPTVTIITPTYNREGLLPETIESILCQSFQDFEYIIVDDGSTDRTRDLVARYGERIVYLHQENRGESAAVNRGWAIARGRYVAIVSSDDPVLPGWLACMVEHMDARPDVVVAYPDWRIIDENGAVVQHVTTFEYDFANMVAWLQTFPGPGTFIRRSPLETLHELRNPKCFYISDLECWLRLALHGPFMRVPVELATWRRHSGSITVAQKTLARAREIVDFARAYFSRPDLPSEIARLRHYALGRAHWLASWVLAETSPVRSVWHLRKSYAISPDDPPGLPLALKRYPRPALNAYFAAYRAYRQANRRRATLPHILIDLRDNEIMRGFHTFAVASLLLPKIGNARWTAIVGPHPEERLAFETFEAACGEKVTRWKPGTAEYDLYLGVASGTPNDADTRTAMAECRKTLLASTAPAEPVTSLDGNDTTAVAEAALKTLVDGHQAA